ncbi:hypothetical protein CDAR_395311 [Caerostris darwini]|uniref:Uncharacterized protein n=1 Tax=Caerostris darwini TaxID=1538125 RepID=A0AAV4QBH3_9ARAC|nr:hypothetical protein CDAR_395311 [Caerostris darwini]
MESILDDIPNSVYDTFEIVHLLTRHDIHNIKEEFKINANGVRHVNDKISINKWVVIMNKRPARRHTQLNKWVRKLPLPETPKVRQSESQVVFVFQKQIKDIVYCMHVSHQ